MIVYGDPAREVRLHELAIALGERCAAMAVPAFDGLGSLEQLGLTRSLLIDVGRLEQAGADHLERAATDAAGARLGATLRTATDAMAQAFCAVWGRTQDGTPAPTRDDVASAGLTRARAALDALIRDVDDALVTVKTPEGFAFYTLYPEQYCVAAHRWADDHAAAVDRDVAVIGVRSIGTTQSAVVATVLTARGWRAHRRTVRPGGAPFARSACLQPGDLGGAARALVVDEGPGISGSSMAAVADALERAGLAAPNISFLPGHGGEPGPMASDAVRERWATTRRYVAPLGSLRWDARSLPELLASSTGAVCGSQAPVERIDDVGGGAWRAFTCDDVTRWPPVTARFERAKYRCALADGNVVLWKFFGADAEAAAERAGALFALGWGPRPLGRVHGFVATEWIAGSSSGRADAGACLRDLAAYVHQAAGPPLDVRERSAAVARLAEMLSCNTSEALGPEAAEHTNRWSAAAAREAERTASATYGDGSMEPHGWLRDGTGRLRKVGGIGHDRDHTVVGRQSIAWDVAGTIVEWGLAGRARDRFLRLVGEFHPELLVEPWMRFHELAYAAFRLGHATMAATPGADAAEDERDARATEWYRHGLAALLGAS